MPVGKLDHHPLVGLLAPYSEISGVKFLVASRMETVVVFWANLLGALLNKSKFRTESVTLKAVCIYHGTYHLVHP